MLLVVLSRLPGRDLRSAKSLASCEAEDGCRLTRRQSCMRLTTLTPWCGWGWASTQAAGCCRKAASPHRTIPSC